MNTEAAVGPRSAPSAELWGHPRLLWTLLTVTVGLNFGFYGFRAYLAPYIEQSFYAGLAPAAAQSQADLLTSGFLALMYATPIIGGYVADKLLGEVRALAISLWLCALALLLMALPSLTGFEIGLALFALAAGLGIPLTVLIGRNYAQADARREGGYTLFYLAINFGAFVAPFLCADFVGQRWGYRAGFVAAAAGMAFGALVLQWRYRSVSAIAPPVAASSQWKPALWAMLAIAVLTYPTAVLISFPEVLSAAMYALMGLMVLYFIASCLRRRDRVQTERYVALFLLLIALVLFWALSLQGVTSLNFFARDYVHAPFDYTLFQSANPLYILIFAVPLAMLWPWLARRGKDPSTPRKFGVGLLLVALSYGLMAVGIRFAVGADGKMAWEWLAGCYLLQTLGELALSPIGYSLVGLLAAPNESSLAMGGWFFGVALAYQLAGWIATMTTGAAGAAGAHSAMAAYGQVYGRLFVVGVLVSLVYLVAAPRVSRLMHGVH